MTAIETLLNHWRREGCLAYDQAGEIIDALDGYEDWRDFERRLNLVTKDLCTCGGHGPDDPEVCLACEVYHAMRQG